MFVLATANEIWKLLNSLVRSGRFDRKIEVQCPTAKDADEIIKHYLSDKKVAERRDICMTVKIICPKTAFFAGHRKLPADTMQISSPLEKELTARIESGHRFFGAGGATGVDTVAALSVLKFWKMHPHIRLILVLPHRAQAKRRSKKDIAAYEDIKKRADKVVCISDEFTRECVYRRNRQFINGSSMCICYLSMEDSGTGKTVRVA